MSRIALGLIAFFVSLAAGAAEAGPRSSQVPEWLLVIGTFVLAMYTFKLWQATTRVAKDASKASAQQAESTLKSIEVATDSMKAMREVAEATRNNAELMSGMLRKQMRSFIAVNTGGPTYQDSKLRFAGEVNIQNVGLTPAKDVSWWIAARVLSAANPDFSKPGSLAMSASDLTLNPHQSVTVGAAVEDRYADEQVVAIMSNTGDKRLFVFGEVHYEDAYGVAHTTQFAHSYTWWFSGEKNEHLHYRASIWRYHNAAT